MVSSGGGGFSGGSGKIILPSDSRIMSLVRMGELICGGKYLCDIYLEAGIMWRNILIINVRIYTTFEH